MTPGNQVEFLQCFKKLDGWKLPLTLFLVISNMKIWQRKLHSSIRHIFVFKTVCSVYTFYARLTNLLHIQGLNRIFKYSLLL